MSRSTSHRSPLRSAAHGSTASGPSARTGCSWQRPEATGRGVGRMLYAALLAELAGEDVHRAFGFTDVGVFSEVGRKFDRWWDVLWLERPV